MRREIDYAKSNEITLIDEAETQQSTNNQSYFQKKKQAIPFQFVKMEKLLQKEQKNSPEISTISRTEHISPDKQTKQIQSQNKPRESRNQQRDSISKIFRIREYSDPTACSNYQGDNKSLPKLVQNQDALQKLNQQILQRTYMNAKIYKGQGIQKSQLVNQTFNQFEINNDSPLKRTYQKSNNQYRNSMVANQRVTSNITQKPISTCNLDLYDSTGKNQQEELEQLLNENFASKLYRFEKEQSEQHDMESINFLKRNSYKRPQFKVNANYQKRGIDDKVRQMNQSKMGNINDDQNKMSTLLNIQPLHSVYKNTETNNDDNLSNTSEILVNKNDQLSRDEIYQLIKKKYQNASFQAYVQQPNQNYEPPNQQIQDTTNHFNKTKLNFRTSSGSRQGGSNTVQDQNSFQVTKQSFNMQAKLLNEQELNKQLTQIPYVKNLNYLERSLLVEKDQAILRKTQLNSESYSPNKQRHDEDYQQLPSSRKGKIVLHINKSKSRLKGSVTPSIKSENIFDNPSNQNNQQDQIDFSKLSNGILLKNNITNNENNLNIINITPKRNRKFSSLDNLDSHVNDIEDLDEVGSQLVSTDVALTNSDKLSQTTDKHKIITIKLENQSAEEQEETSPNVLTDKTEEQSIQEQCSRDEQIQENKLTIERNPIPLVQQESSMQNSQPLLKTKEIEQEKVQTSPINQYKSLTQQTPRGKQEFSMVPQQSNGVNATKASLNTSQCSIEQRQFIRTKRSIPLSTERNNSKSQQSQASTQKNKIKSSMNLDNPSDGKGSKSPSKKGNKQKIIKQVPQVSSKCWSVFNSDTNEFLYGQNHNFQVEIASLTKIMTCYVTIMFLEENKLDIKKVFIEVSKAATKTIGTTANLEKGDQVSCYELLYGLMLPSGNDAAVVLSEGIGYLLTRLQSKLPFTNENTFSGIPGDENIYINYKCKSEAGGLNACSAVFMKEMNKFAWKIGMEKTNYACVHGLSNRYNISTARDVGLLSCIVMKHPLFKKVVNTVEYETVDVLDEKRNNEDQYEWENTNQMLEKKGYDGVKTGVTDTAGPCLSSSYRCKRNGKQQGIICILLNCKSMDHRWPETKQLITWTLKNFFPKEKKQSEGDASSSYSPSPPQKGK